MGLMGSIAVPNVCTFNKKIYCKISTFKYFCAMNIFHQQNDVFLPEDWIVSTATGQLMPSSALEKATLQGLYFD